MHLSFDYRFPALEPEWASRVDRWYQLDAYAYGISEAYWQWKKTGALAGKPSMIILASPLASNETDRSFALSGAKSPSKFAHTLPNIRSSPLCQVMEWDGVILCLQKDPDTFGAASHEAETFVSESCPRVWVLGVTKQGEGRYTVGFREYRKHG